MSQWQLFSNHLPNTTINDIEVNNIENHVLVATYGRGIWRSPVAPSSLFVDHTKVAELTPKKVVLFPNPVKDIANIDIQIDEPIELLVYNLAGKMVLKTNFQKLNKETPLNFNQLPSGVYVFNLISEKHLITQKFLKE